MRIIAVFIAFFTRFADLEASTPIKLSQISYKEGRFGDTITCHFDKEPFCSFIPTKSDAENGSFSHRATFFMQDVKIASSQAKQAIAQLSRVGHPDYQVDVQEVSAPMRGVRVTIYYNPERITCEYAASDSVKAHKTIAFNVRHKSVLNELKTKTDRLLHYAFLDNEEPRSFHPICA